MKKVSPKIVLYAAGLVIALVYLAYTVTSTRPRADGSGGAKQAEKAAPAVAAKSSRTSLAQAAPSDADFARYQIIVRRDIFSTPRPPAPPKPPISIPPPIVISPEEGRPRPPQPPPAPSLTSWSYVGYMTLDGTTTGLIQNDETHSFKELKLGEQFQGYKVDAISREAMTLSYGATKVSLKKPLDYPIVPLQAPPGGGAQPGRPGGPGTRRGGGGGPPER